MLNQDNQKEMISQEIAIHRRLSHKFVVKFHSYFEDSKNLYIILELCPNRSLVEMQKRRKVLTEDEVRYFLNQIARACVYIHENKIIHRDLKLANLFINNDMEVKVGDFGLATCVDDGEKKKTLCGTPNYIAPEILLKRGHSYEVDVWSLGCIMYNLLVGQPPFETTSLKETYLKIKKNDYHIPHKVSLPAKLLIQKMLKSEPCERPSIAEILDDPFFKAGNLPGRIPTSCLTMPPYNSSRQSNHLSCTSSKVPLSFKNKGEIEKEKANNNGAKIENAGTDKYEDEEKENVCCSNDEEPHDYYIKDLCCLLKSVVGNFPRSSQHLHDEALDPAAIPFIWISKWVDYTDKYGFGYQLCDNSVGVLFNDSTSLIILADGQNFHYIDCNENKSHYQLFDYPSLLKKKVTLMKYFQNYMDDNLVKAGGKTVPRDGDEMTQVPYLRAFFRTDSAMVLHMTNGTLQINFFDHTKVIICPLMGAVSFIDRNKEFLVYRLNLIEKYGCSASLLKCLKYADRVADKLANPQSTRIICKPSVPNVKRKSEVNKK